MDYNGRYKEARRQFDELDAEDRARFLLEASLSTIAKGLEWAGQELADSLEETIGNTYRRSSESTGRETPGAAEPETSQHQTPRNGSSSTGT